MGVGLTLAGVRVFNALLVGVAVVFVVETIVYAIAAFAHDAAYAIDDIGFVIALALGLGAAIVYGARRQTV